jgi:hypothetical protein
VYLIFRSDKMYWDGERWTEYSDRAKRYRRMTIPRTVDDMELEDSGNSPSAWTYHGTDNLHAKIVFR